MVQDRKSGREVPDRTPVAIPVRFRRAENIHNQMLDLINSERFRQYLANEEIETPEEADDFAIEDEYDPYSPYEMSLDQELRGPADDQRELEERRNALDTANGGRSNRGEEETSPNARKGKDKPRGVRRSREEPNEDEERPRRGERRRVEYYDDDD